MPTIEEVNKTLEPFANDSYLSDGVYVKFDGFQLWLHTQEGNRIALEPDTWNLLAAYHKRLMAALESLGLAKDDVGQVPVQ